MLVMDIDLDTDQVLVCRTLANGVRRVDPVDRDRDDFRRWEVVASFGEIWSMLGEDGLVSADAQIGGD